VRRVFDASDLETARIAVGHQSILCTAGYLFLGLDAADETILKIGRAASLSPNREWTGDSGTVLPSDGTGAVTPFTRDPAALSDTLAGGSSPELGGAVENAHPEQGGACERRDSEVYVRRNSGAASR
jgi:hypothetical protein